jgi:hypothetical protein
LGVAITSSGYGAGFVFFGLLAVRAGGDFGKSSLVARDEVARDGCGVIFNSGTAPPESKSSAAIGADRV